MQMNSFKRSAVSLALLAATLAVGTAHAGTVTLDVGGIASNGEAGDPTNETRSLNVFAGVHITGISWNVSLSTVDTSWLSEVGVGLNGSAVTLYPGLGDDAPGTGNYSGSFDLVAGGLDFVLGADGMLNFEFLEFFDDFAGADAFWNRGSSLTVSFVPEPATYGLVGLALLGVAATTRRRRSSK